MVLGGVSIAPRSLIWILVASLALYALFIVSQNGYRTNNSLTPDFKELCNLSSVVGMDLRSLVVLNQASIKPPVQWLSVIPPRAPTSELYLTRFPDRANNIPGLGNLCFEFASSFSLAMAGERRFAIDSVNFAKFLSVFNTSQLVNSSVISSIDNINVLPEVAASKYHGGYLAALNMLPSNLTLPGYLQSWKYFHPAWPDLRPFFQFKANIQKAAENVMKALVESPAGKDVVTVGIHVRRGDITEQFSEKHGHKAAPLEYFRSAMLYFTKKFPKVIFIVATNDAAWVKSNLAADFKMLILEAHMYKDARTPDEISGADLWMLTLCHHIIQSVGTFSWWAAYLNEMLRMPNDKRKLDVIYYSDWPRKGSEFSKLFDAKDFFLPHWIPM